MNRRDFIRTAGAATLSALAAGEPVSAIASSEAHAARTAATADAVILLWMAGGMAHTETFDPKRYTPYETGLNPDRVLSTFPSIPTAVDNIRLSAGMENIAKVMDRASLIRTYKAGDLGFILHTRHQFQWHTGYAPPQTVAAPHIGSVIARTLGPINKAMPAFIDIGQRFDVGEGEELKAFHTAGFLGTEFGPLVLPYPDQAMNAVRPPFGMTKSRFENRDLFYRKLVASSPITRYGSEYQRDSLLRSVDNAYRLLDSPAAAAFDLSLEPRDSYAAYNTGRFGQGCLLARRLLEAGARFIEVTTEYIPFFNWDTHDNGHTRMVGMKQQVDGPIARLITDLERSGHLDRTLVIVASEFSRDMLTEGSPDKKVKDQVVVPSTINELKYYGMHRHFTDAGSVLMAGGGVRKGYLYGETADERPCSIVDRPVPIQDLHATILTALGISPRQAYMVEQRPFYATYNGEGKPVRDLYARG